MYKLQRTLEKIEIQFWLIFSLYFYITVDISLSMVEFKTRSSVPVITLGIISIFPCRNENEGLLSFPGSDDSADTLQKIQYIITVNIKLFSEILSLETAQFRHNQVMILMVAALIEYVKHQ